MHVVITLVISLACGALGAALGYAMSSPYAEEEDFTFAVVLGVFAFFLALVVCVAAFNHDNPNSFKGRCISAKGEYIYNSDASLCVKDGLIIDHE